MVYTNLVTVLAETLLVLGENREQNSELIGNIDDLINEGREHNKPPFSILKFVLDTNPTVERIYKAFKLDYFYGLTVEEALEALDKINEIIDNTERVGSKVLFAFAKEAEQKFHNDEIHRKVGLLHNRLTLMARGAKDREDRERYEAESSVDW